MISVLFVPYNQALFQKLIPHSKVYILLQKMSSTESLRTENQIFEQTYEQKQK